MKEDLNIWKYSPCSWIEHNIDKMAILPNLIYRFRAITIKHSAGHFADFDKLTLKVLWKCKEPRKAKQSWGKMNKVLNFEIWKHRSQKSGTCASRFQNFLQSYSNQDSVASPRKYQKADDAGAA